jgi:hypothetical protein
MTPGPTLLHRVLTGISVITVLTGATQVIAPAAVLRPIGADTSRTSRHLFATVGMFMVVVGGLVTQTLGTGHPDRTTLAWGAAQKAGAAVAVTVGVHRRVFSPLALLVAAFDACTAILLLVRRRQAR